MNYIDIVLLLLLVFSAFGGFKNGLIAEVVSLAALILGIWGAIEFSSVTAEFLTEKLNLKTEHLDIISFIVTFIVIVILVHIVGSTINKLVDAVTLGFVNKLAGMVFAVLKSALILSIVLLVFDRIDRNMKILSERAKSESRMYEPIKNFAPSLLPFINFWDNEDSDRMKDDKAV